MRIALLSDLHGNEAALDAVLADVARRGVDRIICLGDVATLGPKPREVLARLRDIACACILGNHDAFMLDPELIRQYNDAPTIRAAVDWCRSQLNDEDMRQIAGFLPSLRLTLGHDMSALLFHGTPRSHMEDLLCTTGAEELDIMLGGQSATLMAGGHTHIPMLRRHREILFVNPGSVGLAFEQHVNGKVPRLLPFAEWACVDAASGSISVSLNRVGLERRLLRDAAVSVEHPLGPWLAAQYA
ncbi:MAG TPA: metallophosphoesterase family protein [Polyangiaceae bacterium]